MSQLARMGTKVWDAIKEAIIAKATASDKGMNISLGIPVIIKEGIRTARIQNRIKILGMEISRRASRIALCFGFSISKC
ncbi:hypothetical protein D3C86_1929100 [compost metagenome]